MGTDHRLNAGSSSPTPRGDQGSAAPPPQQPSKLRQLLSGSEDDLFRDPFADFAPSAR